MTGGGGLKMVLLGTPRFCILAGSSPSATFSKKKISATFTTIVKWQQCNFSLSGGGGGGGGSNRRISSKRVSVVSFVGSDQLTLQQSLTYKLYLIEHEVRILAGSS